LIAARRRKAGPVKRLCVDEKAVGWGHQYVTIVSCADGEQARVLAVEDDREENSLNRFWRTLTPEQRAAVEAVSMDMWRPLETRRSAMFPTEPQRCLRQLPSGSLPEPRRG